MKKYFRIYTKKILPADVDAEKKERLMATGEYDNWTVTDSPFLYLTAELPPPPLFKDELHENIIPQINLVSSHIFIGTGRLRRGCRPLCCFTVS